MKKLPRSLASNHQALRVGPNDMSGAGFQPTDAPLVLVRTLESYFKKQLFEPGQERAGIEITLTGLRPIWLVIKRYGHTAIIAGVPRSVHGFIESLTICCAGLDNAEDEAAIEAASELILQDATHEYVEALLSKVREQPRPLAVHVHFDEDNLDDPAVRVVTHCVAESFFDQFGLEKPYEASHA